MPRILQSRREVALAALSAAVAGIGAAACAFEIDKGDTRIQVLPAGEFRARDGRPHDAPRWYVDAAVAQSLIDQLAALRSPLPIDYEHQTLNAERNGQPAPAAGFIKSLEWREGVGVFAEVEWTPRARQYIEDGEYRFFSPVIGYDKTSGRVQSLLMGALTNNPALDGLQEITARAAARFQPQVEDSMKNLMVALAATLGLAATATEEEVTQAVAALKAKADSADQAIAALSAKTPDPTQYVPIAAMNELRDQVAALTAKISGNEIDTLVRAALADGRLLPAQEAWARSLGATNLASLKSYIDAAPPIAALTGTQTAGGKPHGGEGNGLTAEEFAVCRQLGLDPSAMKGGAK